MTDERRREQLRAAQQRYLQTPKGRATQAKYNRSAKRAVVQKKYNATDKGVAAKDRHEAQPHRKIRHQFFGTLSAKVCRDLTDSGLRP